jgi:hypothetical protein
VDELKKIEAAVASRSPRPQDMVGIRKTIEYHYGETNDIYAVPADRWFVLTYCSAGDLLEEAGDTVTERPSSSTPGVAFAPGSKIVSRMPVNPGPTVQQIELDIVGYLVAP